MQTEIDTIKKRVEHIRAEINKPHWCGRYCLCSLLKAQLNLLDIMLKKAEGYRNR